MLRRSKRLAGIPAEEPKEQSIKHRVSLTSDTINANRGDLEKTRKELEECKLKLKVEILKNEQLELSEGRHKAEQQSLTFQLNCQKEMREKETKELHRVLNEYMKELKHLRDRYKDLSEEIDGNKMIQKLRQTSGFWRERVQGLRKQLVAKEERKNGEPLEWRICEICLREYGQEEDRTPRILGCGHTLCFECCKMIAHPDYLQCPFDRLVTRLHGKPIDSLPKNFLVLNM